MVVLEDPRALEDLEIMNSLHSKGLKTFSRTSLEEEIHLLTFLMMIMISLVALDFNKNNQRDQKDKVVNKNNKEEILLAWEALETLGVLEIRICLQALEVEE